MNNHDYCPVCGYYDCICRRTKKETSTVEQVIQMQNLGYALATHPEWFTDGSVEL